MEEPNPVLIFDTLNAYQRTGALKAAIELELFTVLGNGPQSAAEVAQACGADPRGIRILCDYLTVLGLLTKNGNDYELNETSAAFLDRNSPRYIGSVAEFVASHEMMDTFRGVAGAVRQGGTLLPEGGSVKLDNDLWVQFAESMAPMMQPAAEFIAATVSEHRSDRPTRVLDVAAGHGMFGVSIAQRCPGVCVVAQDFQAVLAVAQRNAERTGVADRYQLLPGDAKSIDFPAGFDCVLLTNFLHHFDEPTCESLLKKVKSSLSPDGMVLTLEFIPNEDRVTPPTPATFALTMLLTTDRGDAYTFADYERMFTTAGFEDNRWIDVPKSPFRLIISG